MNIQICIYIFRCQNMIIDKKKIFNALKAFGINEIKTKNQLLLTPIDKIEMTMQQKIRNEKNEHQKYNLELFREMIITFILYYRWKPK